MSHIGQSAGLVLSNGPRVIACHECDLLQQEVDLPARGQARCCRCFAALYRSHPDGLERALAFALAAVVCLILSNAFPIIGLEIAGEHIEARLLDTVRAIYADGLGLVAGLILLTTLIAPALHLLVMLMVLLPLRFGFPVRHPVPLMRLLSQICHWGMIEVLFLSILVAIVKLQTLATVIPGIALWALGGLMICFTAAVAAFDTRQVWARIEAVSQ